MPKISAWYDSWYNLSIREFSDIPKAIGDNRFITIELTRDNKILTKNIELEFNEKIDKFFIGISSTKTPKINRFYLKDSIKNSIFKFKFYMKKLK